MFIVFALLMLVNYATDKERFLFAYRLDVFGMPINILDALIALGTLLVAFNFGKREHAAEVTHRALKWVVGTLVVAAMVGAGMGFLTGTDPRQSALMGRNVLNLAFAALIGYCAATNLRLAKWAGYVLLLSSFASACNTLIFMRGSAESMSTSAQAGSFNTLRTTSMGGDLGLVCAGFFAFCFVSGLRYVPWLVAWGAFLVSAVAAWALPHRSVYLANFVTMAYAVLRLPPVRMGRRVGTTGLIGAVLGVALVLGAGMYSRMSGRDFGEYVKTRLLSMLPDTDVRRENRAWDSRLPGIAAELRMWVSSPILGHGFGSQQVLEKEAAATGSARHNVWTSSLAEGGIPLFVGYVLPCALCVVVGRRLVRDRFDYTTMMVGAIAAIHGVMCLVNCTTTMYINQQRPAIPLGLICGLVLRVRQMELALAQEYAGYLDGDEPEPMLRPIEEYA